VENRESEWIGVSASVLAVSAIHAANLGRPHLNEEEENAISDLPPLYRYPAFLLVGVELLRAPVAVPNSPLKHPTCSP
jgi:hypothetical protein